MSSYIWRSPTVRLSSSFDIRYIFELSFQCHRFEVNQHPVAKVMPVLLKSGQSASREKAVEEMNDCRSMGSNRLEHAKAGAQAPILISTSPSQVMKWQQEAEQECMMVVSGTEIPKPLIVSRSRSAGQLQSLFSSNSSCLKLVLVAVSSS
ncbi:hypothetical protein F2Q70_00004590 [Brassica cretica]|uniref:Uncharacterized protein n=1 Tax=Brassica cretica TaxID=69181 RepID=A0A8S9IWJ8_BRACR|nr:hypothetical protein F2Q70_00004590 [Brassica cretica]